MILCNSKTSPQTGNSKLSLHPNHHRMSWENQRVRRHVNRTTSYKQNNTRFDLRLRVKLKKTGRDVGVESPEYQLLVRLYVPSNLLITNNKVDLDELMQYLPTIINDGLPQLNYEIHIFLSYIVSKYVLSWYLLKLNTDDTKFISRIYVILCEVVKLFSSRILSVVEGPLILHFMNEVGLILSKHIDNCKIVNEHPHFYEKFMRDSRSLPYYHQSYEEVKEQFLNKNHVVFGQNPDISRSDSMPSYLRILAKNILVTTLENSEFKSDLSPIAQNLVSAILGELVLLKVIQLVSKPEFIMNNAFVRLGGALNKKKPAPLEHVKMSFLLFHSIYVIVEVIWVKLMNLMTFFKHAEVVSNLPVLEDYFLVYLIDSIFEVKRRRPVAVSIMDYFVSIVLYLFGMKRQVESFIGNVLLVKLWQSSVLEDSTLAGIVKNLRESIFERGQDSKKNPPNDSLDAFQKAQNSLLALYRLSQSLDLGLSKLINWMIDVDENENDIESSISNFLSIFNNESSESLRESSALNNLLALNILDCFVKYTYPELTDAAI